MRAAKVEYFTHIVKTKKATRTIKNQRTGRDMDISVETVITDRIIKDGEVKQ